jgi:hypothetical protein
MLVPAAWLVVAGAHRGVVGETAIFIAHLVMAGFIALFAVTGWSAMASGALRAWRAVLVVGLGVTVAGLVGFTLDARPLLAVSLVGWMALPAAALLYTGRLFDEARRLYYGSGTLSAIGTLVYLVSIAGSADLLSLAGIALVAVGQTVGILHATVRS